jgi:hypothetical protein
MGGQDDHGPRTPRSGRTVEEILGFYRLLGIGAAFRLHHADGPLMPARLPTGDLDGNFQAWADGPLPAGEVDA